MYDVNVNSRPKCENLGLGTGTVCTGSSNLLIDPASIFASSFFLMYVQEKRHIIVRNPTDAFRMEREGRTDNGLHYCCISELVGHSFYARR